MNVLLYTCTLHSEENEVGSDSRQVSFLCSYYCFVLFTIAVNVMPRWSDLVKRLAKQRLISFTLLQQVTSAKLEPDEQIATFMHVSVLYPAWVRVCVRACVRACARECVRSCV